MNPPVKPIAGDVRIALLGCGRISRNHLEAIAKIEGLRLVAVADADRARADAVGAEQGVPAFDSLEAMLAEMPADLVSICTPSGVHPQHGIVAARSRPHVL